jgi:probable phosphoglycerate mutase
MTVDLDTLRLDDEYEGLKPQKWPDNFVIVRHGRSKRNHDREVAKKAGQAADFSAGIRDQDTPLTSVGEMQSQSVGVYLRKQFPEINKGKNARPIDVIYVSPYLRTRQTMAKIIEGLGYTPQIIIHDERIREIEFGLLDGLDRSGIKAKYPEEILRKEREGKYFYRAPGGESRPDVRLRLRSFIDTVVRDCRGLNVLVVCHSVVVLSMRSLLEKWGEDDYLQVDKEDDVKNASVTHYAFDHKGTRKLVLKEYNSIFYTEED